MVCNNAGNNDFHSPVISHRTVTRVLPPSVQVYSVSGHSPEHRSSTWFGYKISIFTT